MADCLTSTSFSAYSFHTTAFPARSRSIVYFLQRASFVDTSAKTANVQIGLSILLKNPRSSFENLRTNGGAIEIIGHFPFMLSLVEAFIGFFSRIVIMI